MDNYQLVSALITGINVLIAATAIIINNRMALRREIRKEFRNKYDSLQKRIEEIESLSVEFHTGASHNGLLADEIKWKVDRVSKIMNSIAELKNKKIIDSFTDYKKSMMTNNFGRSKFALQLPDGDIIRDIHHSTSILISEIEKSFYIANQSK